MGTCIVGKQIRTVENEMETQVADSMKLSLCREQFRPKP